MRRDSQAAVLRPEVIEQFDPPADIKGTLMEKPYLITRSLFVRFLRGTPVVEIIRELAEVRLRLGGDRYYLGEFFLRLGAALPMLNPMAHAGNLAQAFAEYEQSRARKEEARARQAETRARRSALLDALKATETFVDERDDIPTEEFAKEWMPHWVALGQKARDCGMSSFHDVQVPADPALRIAKLLLELAVTEAPPDKLVRAISEAITRLKKDRGGDIWALRSIFVIVCDHLVKTWAGTPDEDNAAERVERSRQEGAAEASPAQTFPPAPLFLPTNEQQQLPEHPSEAAIAALTRPRVADPANGEAPLPAVQPAAPAKPKAARVRPSPVPRKKPRLRLQPGWIYFQDGVEVFGLPDSTLYDYVGELDGKDVDKDPNGLKIVKEQALRELLQKKGKLKQ